MTANTPGNRTTERETVTIPAQLSEQIDARIANTSFKNRDVYVTAALEQLLAQVESDSGSKQVIVNEAENTPEAVKDQLESLGYL